MERDEELRLMKLVAHPIRLAILLTLAARNTASLSDLEKLLGVPRQTIHTHLRKLVESGLVVRRVSLSPRPRPVYSFNWGRAEDVLRVLRGLRSRIEEVLKSIEERALSES